MLQAVIAFHLIQGNGSHQGFDRKIRRKEKKRKKTLYLDVGLTQAW
jgi:hypothetical protein